MDRFEYLIGLISLIVGLGLADIATSLHRLIRHRSSVRWDWIALATAAFAAVTMVWIWYNIWDLRDFAGVDGFVFYLTLLAEMFLLFLAAAACLPDERESDARKGWDLSAYYDRTHGYIWTLMALFHASYLLRWIYFAGLSGPLLEAMTKRAPGMLLVTGTTALCVALIFARGRRWQWALLIILTIVKVIPELSSTL